MSDLNLDEYEVGLPAVDGGVEASHDSAAALNQANNDFATQIDDLGVMDLGVDDAVSTAKVRKPQPKLDANRLLNPHKGYPALLKSIGKLKYQKGAERKYLEKYVMTHQLWANRVWPKANFDDFIVIVRRAGKDRRVREYVRELIEKEKYGSRGNPRDSRDETLPMSAGDEAAPAVERGESGEDSDSERRTGREKRNGSEKRERDGSEEQVDKEDRQSSHDVEHTTAASISHAEELERALFEIGPDEDELEAQRELYGDIDF